MSVALIVACARNRVIGADNRLPWHLPEDLRHFKALTMGKPLVMGRKTFDSIGRPLPGRTTLVVTRQRDWRAEGVEVRHSLAEALGRASELVPVGGEIMVAGGEEIYRQALPLADTIYLTEVAIDVEGDAHFPPLAQNEWRECERKTGCCSKSGLEFAFVQLQKR